MAQSDQTVQNATFPSVRADINDNLAALYSQSSGASAPTVTVAFQPWVDTSVSPPLWKIRNAANTGWITVGVLDASFEVGGITQIANGGTGQTTATAAINALLPSQTGNSTKALTTDGTNVSWGIAGGGLIRVPQILTSGTSYTTPAGCSKIYVEAVGGGQGGDGVWSSSFGGLTTGGGGNSGGFCAKFFTVTASTSYAMTIGAAGTGGVAPGPGGTGPGGSGGNTTFTVGATTITAYGGATTLTAPTNGDINRFGEIAATAAGGIGANSYFQPGGVVSTNGLYGSGGGGATTSTANTKVDGAAGGSGMIRIWEYS